MSQQQSQSPSDQTTNFFWLLVLILLAGLSIWFFAREWFITPIFWVRLYEVELIKFVITNLSSVNNFLHIPLPSLDDLLKSQSYILQIEPDKVKWEDFVQVNTYVGNLVRFPVAFILVVIGMIVYFRHGQLRFRQSHTMQTLKDIGSQNWPEITPVLSLDLVKEDIEKGPWAMAKTPLQYAEMHNIAQVTEMNKIKVWTAEKGTASRLFSLQLGPLWQGVDALPIHAKALAVIFVARAVRDRDIAHKFLNQISASAGGGKLDFTGVEEALQKYKTSKVIRWVEKRHAYVNTFMATLLQVGRSDGVLATAEFLWLKPVDRRLWYTLNSVGRQTSVVEVAGIFAHWLAERRIERPLKTPMVKQAVAALQTALEDTLYVAAGEKWHTLKED